jgi:hypothetical protein
MVLAVWQADGFHLKNHLVLSGKREGYPSLLPERTK